MLFDTNFDPEIQETVPASLANELIVDRGSNVASIISYDSIAYTSPDFHLSQ